VIPRRRVCILLPSIGLYPELGVMLEDSFASLGWQATVRHRAEPQALDHDLLLLAGFCRHIEGLPDLLRQRRPKSPPTVLWQLEPLPPPQFSASGEKTGARVAVCDWNRLSPRWRRALNFVVPFRTKLFPLLRRGLAHSYSRYAVRQPDQDGWKRYSVDNYFMAMADWLWIRRAQAHGWFDACFASVQPRVEFLRRRGIAAEMLPFGYHPNWGRDLRLQRDIDVLFLGRIAPGPRGEVLRRLQAELAARGRTLTFVRGVRGAEREHVLNRARIMVNLLRMPHDLAGMRVLMGIACGALVVSEHADATGAFLPGKHFVMTAPDRLAEKIDYFLAHEEERQKIAAEGYRFVTQELTLAKGLGRILASVAVGKSDI